jgi:hypothetical protein
MRLIAGFQDTRLNKEDFAITPFLFGVCATLGIVSVYGIGLCWGYYSVYIGFGFGIPKDYPTFKILKFKNKQDVSKSI